MDDDLSAELAALCRELGQGHRDLAILAEGNCSARSGPEHLVVKASGSSMSTMTERDVVVVRWPTVLDALDEDLDDGAWAGVMRSAAAGGTRTPSIETPIHAVAVGICGASWVAHTHPTPVNALLCSSRPELLGLGPVFPDQVVVCGNDYCFVPYVDPGQPLGREFRKRVLDHRERCGTWPRVVLLQSHGMVALGESARDVLNITEMMVKAARVVLGAASVGQPVHLGGVDRARLAGRADELARADLVRGGPA